MRTALYTTAPPTCDDNLSNCASYGVASCGGAYMGWAQENCKRYCGYCGERSVRVVNLARSLVYRRVQESCKRYCGYCGERSVRVVSLVH